LWHEAGKTTTGKRLDQNWDGSRPEETAAEKKNWKAQGRVRSLSGSALMSQAAASPRTHGALGVMLYSRGGMRFQTSVDANATQAENRNSFSSRTSHDGDFDQVP